MRYASLTEKLKFVSKELKGEEWTILFSDSITDLTKAYLVATLGRLKKFTFLYYF